MIVTKLEEISSNRYKVFIEEQFAFVLYKGELSRFKIKVGKELSNEEYNQIKVEIILKRAKKRILYLLEQMPRTERQLRTKMKQNFYPEDIIDAAIEYAKKFGYVNDENYAKSYILMKKDGKSKREIYSKLLSKGIDKNILEQCMGEIYDEESEVDVLRRIVEKKRFDIEACTEKEKQKMYSYLMRKGFSYSKICQVLRVSEWNA